MYIADRWKRPACRRKSAVTCARFARCRIMAGGRNRFSIWKHGIARITAAVSGPQGLAQMTAFDTLAREELGLDPSALGNPWTAAASSFVAFACGAAIPVIPYFITSGNSAFITSAVVCGSSLFVIGGLISIFTGRNFFFSGF